MPAAQGIGVDQYGQGKSQDDPKDDSHRSEPDPCIEEDLIEDGIFDKFHIIAKADEFAASYGCHLKQIKVLKAQKKVVERWEEIHKKKKQN